jgi:invasion protein IalB
VLRKTVLALSLAAAGGFAHAQTEQDVVRTAIGDWTKLCVDGGQVCVIEQVGKTAAGEDALSFQVEKLATPQQVNGAAVNAIANIRVPLGVVLTQGLRLQIDQGEMAASPFFLCQQAGCLVRAPLPEDLLNRLRRGARATLAFTVIQNGEPEEISVSISLSGFTRAFTEL